MRHFGSFSTQDGVYKFTQKAISSNIDLSSFVLLIFSSVLKKKFTELKTNQNLSWIRSFSFFQNVKIDFSEIHHEYIPCYEYKMSKIHILKITVFRNAVINAI